MSNALIERKWFGTDGIRGAYGTDVMTPAFAWRVGNAAARFFSQQSGNTSFLIGRDTRSSGPALEVALQAGIEASGGKVVNAGVLPTAAIAHFTQEDGFAAGVMLSASHNSAEDNGIKFFGPDGFKLPDETEAAIETLIAEIQAPEEIPQPPLEVSFEADESLKSRWLDKLKTTLPTELSFSGVKIVLDAAHGAAWQVSAQLLKDLGADVVEIASVPDGVNINKDCGSTHAEALETSVKERNSSEACWIGLAHDGDADRFLLIDEKGAALDGDEALAIAGLAYHKAGTLKGGCVVATVMSNQGLAECLAEKGIELVRAKVGDRYVLADMKAKGANIGGEQSGHMIFLDDLTTGDGLFSALQVLAVKVRRGISLNELRQVMSRYPQRLTNLKTSSKPPLSELAEVQAAVKEAERILADAGRVLLRYSGTENKIRLLIEAKEQSLIDQVEPALIAAIQSELG